MANLQERRSESGRLISYSIRVFRGRNAEGRQLKPFTTTFKVEPTWSENTARKKAEAFAAVFERGCKTGLVADTRQTVTEYIRYCLSIKEERGAKSTTLTLYRSLAERLIIPYIGYIKLKDIRPQTLNELYSILSEDGMHKNGGCLSAKTILEVHRLLHTVFDQAMKEMLIPYNPADRVQPPRHRQSDPVFYQPDEVTAILQALQTEPPLWRMLVILLLTSGCRRGEALGLTWEDVDFTYNRIHICRNLLYTIERGVYVDTPKTQNSVRWITLPASTMAELKNYATWQASEKARLAEYYWDQGYLFTQANGNPIHPTSVGSWLTKFSERHGLPHLTAHGFRHTMASMLIYNGVDPVTVSHRLGHDQVSTTTDIYSHMIADADSRSANVIAGILDPT